ncbi:MAG TPA: ABC transporter ATP-binding protein [Acidimicrobiia bacterium]|nr:ABC transporter ATP-binding protein [Acidimicrobiia bacterium]
MTEAAIRVQDVRFSYGKLEALHGISFEVAPGEILGFLGPNGAGKSTTIKILTGQLRLATGRAQVLGMDVTADDPVIQAQIGVCFEEKNLYESMSGRENLRFFARLFGIRDADVDGLLHQVGLADRARDPVAKYSKGMRQRLMMARALVNTPRVLFLDEPTDGLDPVSSRAIRTLIKQEAGRGAAVLLTTHDMFEADELSDRVAFINEGRIHAVDTPENLKLRHGRRAVKVRVRAAEGVSEQSVPLDAADAGERLGAALRDPGLMTIHTEEATLESIFIEMTGRGLGG